MLHYPVSLPLLSLRGDVPDLLKHGLGFWGGILVGMVLPISSELASEGLIYLDCHLSISFLEPR
jgi:hypothetical protein